MGRSLTRRPLRVQDALDALYRSIQAGPRLAVVERESLPRDLPHKDATRGRIASRIDELLPSAFTPTLSEGHGGSSRNDLLSSSPSSPTNWLGGFRAP